MLIAAGFKGAGVISAAMIDPIQTKVAARNAPTTSRRNIKELDMFLSSVSKPQALSNLSHCAAGRPGARASGHTGLSPRDTIAPKCIASRRKCRMRIISVSLACVLISAAAMAATRGVTFNKDVLPVLQKNCQECHRPGEVAPMSLLTYAEVRPWAKALKAAVPPQ